MRCESAVSNRRASVQVATIVAAALLVLGVIGGAFGQNGEVVAGDDIKHRSVCQNLIGEIGVFLDQAGNAAAATLYGDLAAEGA
jgi:hypothetical protein